MRRRGRWDCPERRDGRAAGVTPATRVKLLVAGAGLSVWGIGVRYGDERFRWAGIALLAIAFLLRLFRRRPVDDEE